jgi:hypothetical protein
MATFTIAITYTNGQVETPEMDIATAQKLMDEKMNSRLHPEIESITINFESSHQGANASLQPWSSGRGVEK